MHVANLGSRKCYRRIVCHRGGASLVIVSPTAGVQRFAQSCENDVIAWQPVTLQFLLNIHYVPDLLTPISVLSVA